LWNEQLVANTINSKLLTQSIPLINSNNFSSYFTANNDAIAVLPSNENNGICFVHLISIRNMSSQAIQIKSEDIDTFLGYY
jgi:hypothetical protein